MAVIGIDLGGTKITGALFDEKGKTLCRRILLNLTILIFASCLANAQTLSVNGKASVETLLSSSGRQPFYFWANKLGQVEALAQHNSFIHFYTESVYRLPGEKNSFFAGLNTNLRQTASSKYNLTELFGGFESKFFRITGGLFADSLRFSGLSPSNGNFDITRNAPPHPRVRIGSNKFIRIGSTNFSVAGMYEDGILEKNRIIPKARLHHKNLSLRMGSLQSLQVTAGLDHFVFWGGDIDGDLHRENLKNYLKAIFSGSYTIEELGIPNALGNQLGQYQLSFGKSMKKMNATFQISHIFEDGSGTYLMNYPDNLYTLFLDLKSCKLIRKILVEYVHTLHHSGPTRDPETGEHLPRGGDNYFSHSQYQSGFTYRGFIIGTPLFGPVRYTNSGIPHGPENNRFTAFHFGASGEIAHLLQYRLMTTYSRNRGRLSPKYEKVRNQFYSLAALKYTFGKAKNLHAEMQFAFDRGTLWTANERSDAGATVSFSYSF